jgi:hypothetical protein
MNPYTPVSVSKTEKFPRTNTPTDGEAVGVEFGGNSVNPPRFLIEDSKNWYSWIEALNGDSYADLDEMR